MEKQESYIYSSLGGAWIDGVSYSWPLARLSGKSDLIKIKLFLGEELKIKTDDLLIMKPRTIIPLILWGVEFDFHDQIGQRRNLMFWTLIKSPSAVISGIKKTGFKYSG